MTTFALTITKNEKLKKVLKSFFSSGIVHCWIIPLLHAALWATGLFCALKVEEIFLCQNSEGIEMIKFLAIFIILFGEVMVVLIDIYVSQKANYLAPTFILFVIILLMVIVGTAISAGVALASNSSTIEPFLGVLMFSSLLKFIENLLVNNTNWYIVRIPTIYDARGIYVNRTLV